MSATANKSNLRSAKFDAASGKILLSGIDALVRIALERKRLDEKLGWETAGFISGYRGSPLGSFDMRLMKESKRLSDHKIIFQPGINEDLAATAVWGTQQVGLYDGAKYDGIFGIWYGKTPGVDRSGDALKHANYAGTSRQGGVLAIAGDDHGCKSSSIPGQSEYNFVDAEIPVLAPSTIEEVLYFGVKAFDMSRYCGLWAAMTVVAELMDSTVNITLDPEKFKSITPDTDSDNLHIRLNDTPIEQEARLRQKRRPAAEDFAFHNDFDKFIYMPKKASLCIVTQGKAYRDVMQAFANLGIDNHMAEKIGLRLYKPGLVWPLEKRRATQALSNVSEVLVIEERRSLVETQLREYLCDLTDKERPVILGKTDRTGSPLIPDFGELNADLLTKIIYDFLPKKFQTASMEQTVRLLHESEKSVGERHKRIPFFCPGCPHNSSTKVPDGSRATAGIGCHYLVQSMPRNTSTFTQMGGEGVSWIGQAPFTEEKHIFVNLGDGTYHHSGLLAIRQSVAAKVNVTYKILFNDAVAMTGGQEVDGPLNPVMIAQQLKAEGVGTIVLVGDDISAMRSLGVYPSGTEFFKRTDLEAVQTDLRAKHGVTAIIYVQTCATELRRKRKRGLAPDPKERIFINERVCEGCADCSVKSNCIAVETVETDYGQKRRIDQLACNKDKSCIEGFCPSFVTIEGAELKPPPPKKAIFSELSTPALPKLKNGDTFELILAGVGGQGVTSLSAMLSTAAHIQGLSVNAVDALGMAQKGGAVYTHLKLSHLPESIVNARIGRGSANLVLINDLIVAHGPTIRPHMSAVKTDVFANRRISASAEVVGIRDFTYDRDGMTKDIQSSSKTYFEADTTKAVLDTLGDTIYNNIVLLGMAWQKGTLPLSREAIFLAIESVGAKVDNNKTAFELGRRIVEHDTLSDDLPAEPTPVRSLLKNRMEDLRAYQNSAYSYRFKDVLDYVISGEEKLFNSAGDLSRAAAQSLYKLMAYKDEYEVARLYSDPQFMREIRSQFEGNMKLRLHLAPPIFGRKDAQGNPIKTKFPAWFLTFFKPLARLKFLRGTGFDIFGKTSERKMERDLRDEFETLLKWGIDNLTTENKPLVLQLFEAPKIIKGFGHVKKQSVSAYRRKITRLTKQIESSKVSLIHIEAAE